LFSPLLALLFSLSLKASPQKKPQIAVGVLGVVLKNFRRLNMLKLYKLVIGLIYFPVSEGKEAFEKAKGKRI
jgi:hypothetical protein